MLKHHLNVVCDNVWTRLGNSKKLGISQGEETLTDNLLLYLASQNLHGIRIIQTPKSQESVKGTDWEWWIGNRRSGYLRYAVQAKKLDLKSGRYPRLNHKVGDGASAIFQHNILEDYSRVNQEIPIYTFYNYLESGEYPKDWNCPLPIDYPKFGCTVTPLKNVKTAIANRGWRTFEKIHSFPETLPLRCLAECPGLTLKPSDNDFVYLPNFETKAKVYSDPWGWISEMGNLTNSEQMPSSFYSKSLGYYPKRILQIETE